MSKDSNTMVFNAKVSQVFPYVTQARFWPMWHVDSVTVAGVTQRPFVKGDIIYEKGLTNGVSFDLYWEVVEHEVNKHVALYDKKTDTKLEYFFEEKEGKTYYTRSSVMNPARLKELGVSAGDSVNAASIEASAKSTKNFQELIEMLILKEGMA